MDIRKLQRAIVDGLEDVKAHDIVVFNTEHLSPLFERVIVASGTSNRQTKALASSVRETVKARGLPVLSTEGAENGEWIIVDCGAAVAHIMQPAIRDYYRLEEIWGGKPVRLKLDGQGAQGLPKASDAAPTRRTRPPAADAVVKAHGGESRAPGRTAVSARASAKSAGRKADALPRQPRHGKAAGAKTARHQAAATSSKARPAKPRATLARGSRAAPAKKRGAKR